MKKLLLSILITFIMFPMFADEGMWIPLFLEKYNIEEMQKKGFKLSAKDIYDVNEASMKDAIMIFGGGCTAELISDQGLILTNYHCGYSNVQSHSSVENDYLTNGFWAMSKNEELTNPGLNVTFLVYMKDVTDQILAQVNDQMTLKERQNKIDAESRKIAQKIEDKSEGKYEAVVEPFFYGNQYIVMVTQVFKDVRLVGAPPSAIGKFGGDTDNWVWPRHTGDFSLFRIYADKNNQPAEYSSDNVPFKPKKFFSINIGGIKEGDFTMIFGYPGHTEQYIPSFLVNNTLNIVNPLRIELRTKKLNIIDKAMSSDKKIRIQYASKQARIANGWKKWIGQNQGLKRLGILKEKQKYETKFQKWANSQDNEMYKNLLADYENYAEKISPFEKAYYYFVEIMFYSDNWRIYSSTVRNINAITKESAKKKIKELKKKAIKTVENFFKNYNQKIDREIFKQVLTLFFNENPENFYPNFYSKIKTDFGGDIERFVDHVYDNSILTDEKKLIDFITNFNDNNKTNYNTEDLSKDPFISLIDDFVSIYNYHILPKYGFFDQRIDSLNHLYMQAQMKMEPETVFYPDANFTLRVAHGSVKGFRPRDGIVYDYYTTLDGVIDKDNPEIYDYDVPDKLKNLFAKKDYGRFADKKDGKIHVCFIADNHTSGGNSGSPVINANGELIGVNFDRCWESTMSDIKFDPDYCRNISLDIRYVLFLVDKYAGAGYLIEEMNIVQ
ncbi:MAG: S46 family peptidase [Bacteroidota bacterium]|nr:S46 family peptidase [Bacteroidota bacterium]